MEIIFGQYVEMKLFITLYRALHMNGSFVDLPVQPIWDNSKLALYNSIQETTHDNGIKLFNTNFLFSQIF